MDSRELQVFVDSTVKYFNKFSGTDAKVGAPFLVGDMSEHFEQYTGFIGISGRDSGNIFFTSAQEILVQLLTSMLISDISEENKLDLVGEIANTIAGNVRKELGHDFIISTPVILDGQQETQIKAAKTMENYIIPIHWRSCQANLIINLD